MSNVIDARGLSCPQPVILTNKKIHEMGKGIFEVLVDTDTSKENVSRLASRKDGRSKLKKKMRITVLF